MNLHRIEHLGSLTKNILAYLTLLDISAIAIAIVNSTPVIVINMSTPAPQNRIYFRSDDNPSRRLLSILKPGGCLGFFELIDCVNRKPPKTLQFYPSMFIVGMSELLTGAKAFEYAQVLSSHKQMNDKTAQTMKTAYEAKLIETRLKFSTKEDGLLGYSGREMGSFSDSYSLVANDGHLPQNYQAHGKKEEDGAIITPEISSKMNQDEQAQRIKIIETERSKQDGYFNNMWQTNMQLKLSQFNTPTNQQLVQPQGLITRQ